VVAPPTLVVASTNQPMKSILTTIIIICSLAANTNAQALQTVRGTITDAESKYPLMGATVALTDDPANLQGAAADPNGSYRIEGVKVGRHSLKISCIGYKDIVVENVIVNSGKESILDFALSESIILQKEVTITANKYGEVRNEMATISAKAFSIEETDRYAGSRGDPARMASSYAGVQGADDSRNDIVVRGNSPSGVLWRFEGVDILNPNHFNIPGTTGGSVTVLNNKWLANSDFFTGAFPAEYGNSTAGVFDLRMRNGNNEKYEASAQFGLLGTELLAEGPFSKKSKASWLVSYRYSTLAIFGNLGIKIGTDAVPRYQDAAFRINLPLQNNASLAIFGVGGLSAIDIIVSNKTNNSVDLYSSNDRDQYFHTRTGFVGATYSKAFNTNTFVKMTAMYSGEKVDETNNLIFRHLNTDGNYIIDSLPPVWGYNLQQRKTSLAGLFSHKITRQLTLRAGINADAYHFDFKDTVRTDERPTLNGVINPRYAQFSVRWNSVADAFLAQAYAQLKYTPTDHLTLTAGLHTQYFTLGNAYAPAEPRVGARYELPNNQALTFGAGIHSQIQSTYLYYYQNRVRDYGDHTLYNLNMGFSKAAHFVAGYQKLFGTRTIFKTEAYYQALYEVPIDATVASSFSLVNTGSGFVRFFPQQLTNKGTGENYGIEFTLEKGFSRHYYYMATASLFNATYRGSNGITHNTDFNGKLAANVLFGYEIPINKRQTINIGTKITYTGGRWYGTIDSTASGISKTVVYKDDATFNTHQFAPYFRADLKLNYKINTHRLTHEIGIDIVNIFDTKNILSYAWVPLANDYTKGSVRENYQLGLLPVFYYRCDFGFRQ
jgi:hypothetical protein